MGARAAVEVLGAGRHLRLVSQIEGSRTVWRVGELGKICLWYLKGFSEASRMRAQIFNAKSDQELVDHIDSISNRISP